MISDLTLRDTPALEALGRRRAALGHIDPAALTAAQDLLRVAKRMLGASGRESMDAKGLAERAEHPFGHAQEVLGGR